MRWSERQRAMLEAMGIRLWAPVEPEPAHQAEPEPVADAPEAFAEPAAAAVALIERPAQAAVVAPVARQPLVAKASPAGHDPSRLDWPALRDAVSNCTACRLCEQRRQTVFGVGHPNAQWMIVGEAPGEQEDAVGEPFVGKSGQLLDNMLRAVGLTRADAPPAQQVYIANTVKCRPPGNRNPEPDELAACEPYLSRQIALVQPRIILAMGRFAVQSLLRSKEPIGRLRGRVHQFEGVPLIVTYHPAYLLRSLAEKARAWEDLCLAAETFRALASSPAASNAPP